MVQHLRDLLQETCQTEERIKEGRCSRHIGTRAAGPEAARQDGAFSGKQMPLSILRSHCRSHCLRCVADGGEAAFSRGATPDKAFEAAFVAVLVKGEPVQAHRALAM